MNYVKGELVYLVYRLRDLNDCDHSGNRETVGMFDNEDMAQEYAAELNRRDGR